MLFVIGSFVFFCISSIVLYFKFLRYVDWDGSINNLKELILLLYSVVSILLMIGFSIPTIIFIAEFLTKDVDKQCEYVNRAKLIRMLEENCNPDNLKNALDFNTEQNISKIYNNSPLWYCWENCYVVDTIPIPNEKYIPSNYVKLEAVIEQLAKIKRLIS